ncbi:pentapeptide repeat-containing protein [Acaryochloris marina]|uniref:Pentapeptide repeat protein n=1 Tax=Acaryochloris marina (strain MBIC 11017) TaxID=329726 RepID=A8ZQZ4_ACAM1|nr:pentapeptide repeat-containing protein [Acaryochloris marina]ABW33430.1 pentapeptide repeat protein [Acaryochloris marina MBIC11017]
MANQEQVDLLKQGAEAWNQWREKNTGESIYLWGADLGGANLSGADLGGATLSGANLWDANLTYADLRGATLIYADLRGATLIGAALIGAALIGAALNGANLSDADLSGADLRNTKISAATKIDAKWKLVHELVNKGGEGKDLSGTDLSGANLSDADLSDADLSGADLSDADLSDADLRNTNLRNTKISAETKIDAKWKLVHELVNKGGEGKDLSSTDLSDANLSGTDLSDANLSGTDLSDANLSGADLSDADLSGTDLSDTNLSGTDLSDADLSDADLRNTKISAETKIDAKWKLVHELVNKGGEGKDLSGTDLSGADLSGADLSDADLSGADLSDANLSDADLSGADLRNTKISAETKIDAKWKLVHELVNKGGEGKDLSGTDLNDANLSGVNLRNSNLYRANFLGSKLQNAILTGACIQDWSINSKTGFEGVVCDYIYLKVNQEERRPFQGNFCPGEFVALVQKSLETIDLIFVDGIDWQAFFQSFQLLRSKFNEYEVGIQAIEKKGAAFVVRLEAPPEANKSAIETKAKELYGKQLKVLEEQFIEKMKLQGATLDLAKESLAFERQKNAQLLSMVQTMANKDKVTQNINAPVGNVAGVNEGIQQTTQHNYAPEIKQTPAESAKEIQDLLSQLQKTNPTDIQTVVEQRIKIDPTFRQRLQNALKEGGVETLKVLFAPIGIPIETVRGWIDAEGS